MQRRIAGVPFFDDAEINCVHIQEEVMNVGVVEDLVAMIPKGPREIPQCLDNFTGPRGASGADTVFGKIELLSRAPSGG